MSRSSRSPWCFLVLLALLAYLVPTESRAQDEPPLTEEEGWRRALTGQLSFSQAAYHSWQEGGLNALSLTAGTEGRFARLRGGLKQTHDARLAFGVVRQDTLDVRKAVDVIRYAFDLQYTGAGAFRPTFATEFRTQFAAGFDYNPKTEDYPSLVVAPDARLKVSDFFAPAVWTQSVGVTYDPGRWYTVRLGLGAKETFVLIERLRPVHGNAPDEAVRLQAGLEALAEARKELFEGVLWRSRLTLFEAFNQLSSAAPDLVFENLLQLKVNDWLSTNLELVALYDKDVIDAVQLKEVLSVGVTVSIL